MKADWQRDFRVVARATLLCISALLCAPVAAKPGSVLGGDGEEQQLLAQLRGEKFIRAREQAEKLLAKRPDSFIGRFTLAHVYHQAEGNLPLALYHARLAEAALRKTASLEDAMFPHWHRRVLLMQETILGEMDRRKEQLRLLDKHDELYTPRLELRRIWPLMKLHRFDEATAIAKKATLSADLETRVSGYNGLLSIEFERERPRACFDVAMRAVRATGEQSCILNLNTAEAAFAVFEFAEAERLALKSIQAPIRDCPDSAHQHLAQLYLLRADFRRAIAAIKDARALPVPRRLRQQFEMVMTSWLARLLYALGQFDRSAELSRRVVRAPDRVGLVSFSSALMETIYALDHYAILRAQLERLRERVSARSRWAALKEWSALQRLQLTAWVARRKAAALVARGGYVQSLTRPYVKPLPPWQAPLLARVVGRSIVRTALQRQRASDPANKETESYYLAIGGRVSYDEGDWPTALELGAQALKRLPADEALLRSRTAAWLADAAYASEKTELAHKHFDEVLHRWPTALRLLGVRLPVEIRSGADALARAVSERLLDSRRLRPDDQRMGFVVDVQRRGKQIEVCLSGVRGRRYACSEGNAELQREEDEEARIVRLVDGFHDTVFAPLIDLTQQDINSLDGSAVRARADEVLQEVFGQQGVFGQ